MKKMFAFLFFGLFLLINFEISFAKNIPVKVPCALCSGSGKVICSYCNGKKKVRIKARHTRSNELPCEKCNQTGKRICLKCGGDGELIKYPKPTSTKKGWLKLKFKIRARKNRPAPSWIEIKVDDKIYERVSSKGRVRVYDFQKIPLFPGEKHRLNIKIYFKKSIYGYHRAEAFLHNLIIKNGGVTSNNSNRIKLPKSGNKLENWNGIYKVLFLSMDEAGGFRFEK
jgi:hypothetical protein